MQCMSGANGRRVGNLFRCLFRPKMGGVGGLAAHVLVVPPGQAFFRLAERLPIFSHGTFLEGFRSPSNFVVPCSLCPCRICQYFITAADISIDCGFSDLCRFIQHLVILITTTLNIRLHSLYHNLSTLHVSRRGQCTALQLSGYRLAL